MFVCLQPDHEARADTVGVPIAGVEIKVADNGEILVKSPGLLKEYYKNQCQLLKKKELKLAELPIREDADKEGNKTGKVRIKFTLSAKIKSKKTGKEWEQRPAIFDTKGKIISERVGGGSVLKVACEVFPWYTPALGVGASLRCKAVQVIDLKSPSGVANAEAFGFTAEEEGFVSGGESIPENIFTSDSDAKGSSDF